VVTRLGTLTNPFGALGMKTRILTGVLGVLEIKILIGARKVIGIMDLVMLIKAPFGEEIVAGT